MSSNPIRCLRQLSTTAAAKSSLSISRAKSRLRTEHDPDKALEIYTSVSEHYSSPTSSRYAQDITVRRLAKSHRFADIESFLESHKSDAKITQEPFLSTLIRSYGRAGMFDHAIRTFHEMDQLGTPRTSISFNTLLSACNDSKLFDKVPQLFDEIPHKHHGVKPDKISYGILIKSYCAAERPEKAMETLRVMEEKGVEITAVAFTTIFNALYKKGNCEEAERLWDEMVRKGVEVDAAAYNVKIMYVHGGDADNVKALIEEMANAGLKPDTISYNYLMTCYCRNEMVDEAVKVYEGLEGNACIPNAATFRTLIFYLCRSENYDKAYKVFKRSVEVHKIPDFNTMKYLAEGLVKKKRMKEAKGLIRTIKKKFPPNMLVAWKKVEEGLGLAASSDTNASSSVPDDEANEATG